MTKARVHGYTYPDRATAMDMINKVAKGSMVLIERMEPPFTASELKELEKRFQVLVANAADEGDRPVAYCFASLDQADAGALFIATLRRRGAKNIEHYH